MSRGDSGTPIWWRDAVALEQADRLAEAERRITEAVDHIGAAATVAELYRRRMCRLSDAGDDAGAGLAAEQAERWITIYASQATSGGEGAALSLEREQFLVELANLRRSQGS